MRRYRSDDDDSSRWIGFPFRTGDIVISTRSKSGTTWMQMICALLVHRTAELPAPLTELSPWLDWLVRPRDEVFAALAAQGHRRVIKTHTPLDGVPIDPRAYYIVVARHPLDMAVSMYHQGNNIDRERLAHLTGAALNRSERPPLEEWLSNWVQRDSEHLDSLPGVLAHLTDAWQRREEENILLVHYDDLKDDLAGQMGEIASKLGLEPPTPELVEAATFEKMRNRATELAPDSQGVLKSRAAFFRSGTSGAGREVLGGAAVYEQRARDLAPPDLLEWLHR